MLEPSRELPSEPGVGRLIATNPTDARTREFILLKAEVSIGSDEANDFVIRDATVSRRHAVICFKQGRLEVTDLGSTNGTFVNGLRIQTPTPMQKGDKLRFGGADFVLLIPRAVPAAASISAVASGKKSPSTEPVQRRKSAALRTIAESILIGFVFGFGTAQYLAYLMYHEQSKVLLAEAVPVPNIAAQHAPAGNAVSQNSPSKSIPVQTPSAGTKFREREVDRKSASSPAPAPATHSEVLAAAISLAQLVPGSGRRAGRQAGDFKLPDLQGKSVSLSEFRGKVVLLNFWATWCGACRSEIPSLERLYKNLRRDSFVVLTVNIDQRGSQAVQTFLKRNGYELPVLLDQHNEVSSEYSVSGIPATFIIDPTGEIVWDCAGGIDWSNEDLLAAIEKLIPTA